MAEHNDIGARGEEIAADHLIQNGFKILERNWRHRKTEIDIIAMQGDVLVFIEVKTRTDDYFGEPATFAQDKQLKRVASSASVYMHQIGHDWEVRFDVIGVLMKGPQRAEIIHYKDVYWEGIE